MVQIRENGDQVIDDESADSFCINDHLDLLIEVLQRLDGRSLGAAACVCRQWCSIARNDSLWEHLCFRQVSPPPPIGVRSVVSALGGYRRLYMMCVRPVVNRLKRRRIGGESEVRRVWKKHEVELSLLFFSVEYYERLLLGGGRVSGGGESPASSLKFLSMPLNV